MKNLKLIGFLMILASSLMFIQCTTDTIVGPAGTDGTNGIDGVDGTDGNDGTDGIDGIDGVGTASCIECHSTNHRDAIDAGFALSGHATGTSWARGTSNSCAQCHNNEGFIDYVSGNYIDDDGLADTNPAGYTVSHGITCNGCHSDHRSFDFENDGNDYAVRTLEPVQLITDATYTINMQNNSDLMGKSNTCVVCHQPRRTGPVDDGNGEFTNTSSHWGPHYGSQSILLEGIQGMEIAGSYSYPTPGTATHRSGSSCVKCHMDSPNEDPDSHTFNPKDNACLTCHGSVPSDVYGMEDDLASFATLLENTTGWEYKYLIKRDGAGDPILDDDGDIIFINELGEVVTSSSQYVKELDGSGDPIKVEAHGLVHDGHPSTGFYGRGVTYPIGVAKAAWNYLYLKADGSHGIHNPAYARALVKNSIEALQ